MEKRNENLTEVFFLIDFINNTNQKHNNSNSKVNYLEQQEL